jgi:hypothetical protein
MRVPSESQSKSSTSQRSPGVEPKEMLWYQSDLDLFRVLWEQCTIGISNLVHDLQHSNGFRPGHNCVLRPASSDIQGHSTCFVEEPTGIKFEHLFLCIFAFWDKREFPWPRRGAFNKYRPLGSLNSRKLDVGFCAKGGSQNALPSRGGVCQQGVYI